MTSDPQAPNELREAARHLLLHPLCCKEDDQEVFRVLRRHEAELDRWFTQRLGYRLHLTADTARLDKTGYVPAYRPMRTTSGRAFHRLEYILLALVIAATVAGPAVLSLRDLVDLVRSGAAEAEVTLTEDTSTRHALVTALRWMTDHGLASELHDHVDAYLLDDRADAVLAFRPDRISLLGHASLGSATDADSLLDRSSRRESTRQWLRARLVEDYVLYRDELTDAEWSELRRRLGEEEQFLDEMFGLVVEARAEGVAAIDPSGALSDRAFPAGGTVAHAALLVIEQLRDEREMRVAWTIGDVNALLRRLAPMHERRWSREFVESPERLTSAVIDLLVEVRLGVRDQIDGMPVLNLLPAAGRFVAKEPTRLADELAG